MFRFTLALGLVGLAAFPASAQNTNTVSTPAPPTREGTVGPEQLRDFSLGNTTRAETPPPAAEAPVATPETTAPTPTATTPAPSATVPIVRRPDAARALPGASVAPSPAERPASAVTLDLPPATPAPYPGFESVPTPAPQPRSVAPVSTAEGDGALWWPWMLGAVLLGVLGAMLWRRRSRDEDDDENEEIAAQGGELAFAAPTPAPQPPAPASTFIRTRIPPLGTTPAQAPPVPTPVPAPPPSRPGGIVSTRLRASLEIELITEAAVLDDNELVIQFELRIVNSGSAPARNVVVEAVVLNASETQDAEIMVFFERPDATGEAIEMLGPLEHSSLRSVVRMPRAAMREYVAQDRRLLVPVLAFNAAYRFGTSSGRTSGAWLIGRNTSGAERLGPLRLDQGSRQWTAMSQKRLEPAVRR